MDIFGKIYMIFASVLIIAVGITGIFFTNWFIKINIKLSEYLYRKTGVGIYKKINEEISTPYMRFIIILAGAVLIIIGIKTLIGNI